MSLRQGEAAVHQMELALAFASSSIDYLAASTPCMGRVVCVRSGKGVAVCCARSGQADLLVTAVVGFSRRLLIPPHSSVRHTDIVVISIFSRCGLVIAR